MGGYLKALVVSGGDGGIPIPQSPYEIEYLVAGGGGRGGEGSEAELGPPLLNGGGGGAGGLLSGSIPLPQGATVTVTVGAGATNFGGDGDNSVFDNLTAFGGGGGGNDRANGRPGGSGGGGGQTESGTTSGGAGTAGQGDNGIGGTFEAAGSGGGGGTASSITGASVTYGVGGLSAVQDAPSSNTGNGGSGGVYGGVGNIVVSGAGTSEVDGTYVPDGTFGNHDSTKYRLADTDYYILVSDTAGNFWTIVRLVDGIIEENLYKLNELAIDPETQLVITNTPPPAAGSSTVEEGDSPAPSISTTPNLFQPNFPASGVVVIAYPDTYPALSVGAGLTYDEPSRSGYRVYRFTAGTGVVTFP